MSPKFAAPSADAIPVYLLPAEGVEDAAATLPGQAADWLKATGFRGGLGEFALLPGPAGGLAGVAAGFGTEKARARGRFHLATLAERLPAGTYRLVDTTGAADLTTEALGWLFGQYRFDRYRKGAAAHAHLVAPEGVDANRVQAIAEGECLTRDLINTPAADMGPPDLEQAARALAEKHGASFASIVGDDLLAQNFPMIHAVGRAADRAPRLLDLTWGNTGPTLCLVGKGVCFDTGGLDIKPAASMGLMKKDMGGAATVLGLAHMIMALNLPLRLRVLIPAVENSVSGNAFRPQDILTARNGLTVEINNTDAEGRLVLADALALACETPPDCLISMATLTGAARVAVGPDIAPYFTTDATISQALSDAAEHIADPVWRLPFHVPYEAMIEPGIADLDNAPKGGLGGAITAALFLRRFTEGAPNYTHFDIYGWQPAAAPGRPKGGVGQGARAILEALPKVLNL